MLLRAGKTNMDVSVSTTDKEVLKCYSPKQNRNRLKFGIYDSYLDILLIDNIER